MKNLEQIRAAHALAYATAADQKTRGKEGGNVLKRLPALIMGNGLLASGAFAYAQKSDSGWRTCFDHLAKHLSDSDIGIVQNCQDLTKLMDYLTKSADSQTLKLATEEALAWLGYARRFEQFTNQKENHDSPE